MEDSKHPRSVSAGDRRVDSGGQVEDNDQTPQAEFNAFAGFLEARGLALPTEAECLDFVAERSGSRLAGLREPTSSRHAQLARRPLILLMECLDGGIPQVGQATTPLVDRCPARFRAARDEYLAACRRRGNAEASVATKQRAADLFLAYLDEVGRETLDEAEARDLAGFWARRQRRGYAPKTTGSLRSALADFLRHLHQAGQIREDLAGRLPPQRYPRRGESAPHPWTAEDVRLVLDQIDRQSAIGKRDYAMILLTARLGLRVGDLRRLELGWFDWRAKNLALTQHKTGLPLTSAVAGRRRMGCDRLHPPRPARSGLSAGVRETPLPVHGFRFVHVGGLPAALLRAARRDRVLGRAVARPALAAWRPGGRDAPNRHAPAGGRGGPGSRDCQTTAAHYLRLDTEHLRRCALDVEDVLDAGQGARP